jgi:hypothetical protein
MLRRPQSQYDLPFPIMYHAQATTRITIFSVLVFDSASLSMVPPCMAFQLVETAFSTTSLHCKLRMRPGSDRRRLVSFLAGGWPEAGPSETFAGLGTALLAISGQPTLLRHPLISATVKYSRVSPFRSMC